MHALNCECARVRARRCDVITKGVQQAPPDQLRHHLRPRAPVRARNDPDSPGRVPTCPGTLQTPRRVILVLTNARDRSSDYMHARPLLVLLQVQRSLA